MMWPLIVGYLLLSAALNGWMLSVMHDGRRLTESFEPRCVDCGRPTIVGPYCAMCRRYEDGHG